MSGIRSSVTKLHIPAGAGLGTATDTAAILGVHRLRAGAGLGKATNVAMLVKEIASPRRRA